ncbi:glycosyltransferase family 1 protein [Peniophora sp. CONT]|nr:glycosyltransferase family 1 protein [Peniophora sp. CONT]
MPSQRKTPFHLQENEAKPGNDVADDEVIIGHILTDPGVKFAEYVASGEGLASSARVLEDGRISVSLNLKKALPELPPDYAQDVKEFAIDEKDYTAVPALSIVIMIVGSRGDVQPFLALGQRLKEHGHRVRIATHATFDKFVRDAGLEFFSIGGNPQDLMSYMVKNPGLMPGFESLRNGDIGRKRKMLGEMLGGCWKACYLPDETTSEPFAADAIISNPPAFAHVHCAEALGVPLLLSFTMPWCPTTAFPHPLVNIKQSNAQQGLTNYLSYALADMMTWQGIGDLINEWRKGSLGTQSLSLRSGPGLVDRLKIPWTYCLSPSLVPRPDDWKNHIDIVGFYFVEQDTGYKPPKELAEFLDAGAPPVYIGFGSVVVDDPAGMTETILAAVAQSNVRALISAGWGGLSSSTPLPSNVFILGNISVPHDWLFARVAAVCHHGGAGTIAAGLRAGRPTIVVPFFGDQPFWGEMVHKGGAGPAPIPHKELTADRLAEALKYCTTARAKAAAERMGEQIRAENGVQEGVMSFYRHLPLLNMRCDLDPDRVAVWWSTKHCLKMSAFAAQALIEARELKPEELDLHRPKEYSVRRKISDPLTGGSSAIFWTVTHWYGGIAQIFYNPKKGIINTAVAIPKGVMKIVVSIHEGFVNMPALYGSEVRDTGEITGFQSGVKKAGKDFFYGYYDGITGLVKEPMQGAKKEGFAGLVKGSARSFVNATMRPAAGIVGLVASPLRGAWQSAASLGGTRQAPHLRTIAETRMEEGVRAVQQSSPSERKDVLRQWNELKKTVQERKKRLQEDAVKVLEEEKQDGEAELGQAADAFDTNGGDWVDVPKSTPSTPANADASGSSFEKDMRLALERSLQDK